MLTIGNGTTTAQVAASLKDMWNNASRIDGTGDNTNTSNAGGQEFGEFSEAQAIIYSTSTSVVRIIANTAGVPITITSAAVTAGDGDVTLATAQTATGPWYWNNADNWDTGSAPVDDDVVVFRDSDVPCKYGLPNSTDLECTIEVWMSYTGQVGLPRINRTNASKSYLEYRQRYVRLDDGGTGTNIAHRFGLGKVGTGCTLFNLKHISLKCSPVVYNTGAPQVPGTFALNICCTFSTSTLTVLNGSVDCSTQDGATPLFSTLTVSGGDIRAVAGIDTSGAVVNIDGGTVLIGGSTAIATVNCRGGILTAENQSGTVTTLSCYAAGTVVWKSTGTITTYKSYGGTFDARDSDSFTIGTSSIYRGSKFFDPYNRMAVGTSFGLFYDPSPDLQFGANDTTAITIGA